MREEHLRERKLDLEHAMQERKLDLEHEMLDKTTPIEAIRVAAIAGEGTQHCKDWKERNSVRKSTSNVTKFEIADVRTNIPVTNKTKISFCLTHSATTIISHIPP